MLEETARKSSLFMMWLNEGKGPARAANLSQKSWQHMKGRRPRRVLQSRTELSHQTWLLLIYMLGFQVNWMRKMFSLWRTSKNKHPRRFVDVKASICLHEYMSAPNMNLDFSPNKREDHEADEPLRAGRRRFKDLLWLTFPPSFDSGLP